MKGQSLTTLFNLNGSWIQTKHQINYEDAPEIVRSLLAEKYETDDMTEVYEVEMKTNTYYKFMMKTQHKKYAVIYDTKGEFIKRTGELYRSLE